MRAVPPSNTRPVGRVLAAMGLVAMVLVGACGDSAAKKQTPLPNRCGQSGGGNGGGPAATGGVGGTAPGAGYPSPACAALAADLVSQMTLDEKLAQLLQLDRAQVTPADLQQYGIGSVFSQGGSAPADNSPDGWADMNDAYQQAARASRLGIPMLYGIDNVHGAGPVKGATVFPHNIGLGATRDAALVEAIARATARESLGCGLNLPFSPVLAVARDERWGRTYEAFGETTELVTTMGLAMIRGLQVAPGGGPTGVVANAKHFVGDGGTDKGITGGSTAGDEATLRAIHLEPYRAAVAAHVGTIMPSYSAWQGTRMHANRAMLTDLLKGELGFGGFVLSDYNACYQLDLVDKRDGLAACLNAGVDMFMLMDYSGGGPTIYRDTVANLRELVETCTVPLARVEDAARRIVAVKCELGLTPGAHTPVDRTLTAQVGSAEHRQLARRAVQQSLVLLKNEGGVLPLSRTEAIIALGGNSADNTGNQCGGWTITWQGSTGNVVPGATSIRAALETAIGADRIAYSADGGRRSAAAGPATIGLVVIGELPYAEGKGDRTDLTIPDEQVAVARAMKQAGLPTVVVLMSGRPMILAPILPYADAVVAAWLPGSEGAGVTDVLLGEAAPTGKLPHSWPRDMEQLPINDGDRTYEPLFPYGFGLSY